MLENSPYYQQMASKTVGTDVPQDNTIHGLNVSIASGNSKPDSSSNTDDIVNEMKVAGYKPVAQQQAESSDLISQMKTAGYKPVSGNSTLSDAITGFNSKVENTVALPVINHLANSPLGRFVADMTSKVFGENVNNKISSYEDTQTQKLKAAQLNSPTATSVGQTAATIGLTSPIALMGGESLVAGNALQGAAIGAMQNSNGTAYDMIDGAKNGFITGAVASAGLSALSSGISATTGAVKNAFMNTIQNVSSMVKQGYFKNGNQFTDDLISKVAEKSGGLTNVTQPQFAANLTNEIVKRQMAASSLYNNRNAIAKASGIEVSRDNLANTVKSLTDLQTQGSTTAVQGALTEAKAVLGNGETVPFSRAQELLSGLNAAASKAKIQGDSDLSRQLSLVSNSLEMDMQKSAEKVPELGAANELATSYYRDNVAPLNTLANKLQIQDNFTSEKLLQTLFSKSATSNSINKGFNAMSPELQTQARLAYVNALRANTTTNGSINFAEFAKDLQNGLQQYPQLQGATNDLNSLAQALNIKAQVNKAGLGQGGNLVDVTSSGIGAFLGGPIGAVVGAGARRSIILYKAAQMLNDPVKSGLVKATGTAINNNVATPIKTQLVNRIASQMAAIKMTEPQQ